jgi:hypothetical protein
VRLRLDDFYKIGNIMNIKNYITRKIKKLSTFARVWSKTGYLPHSINEIETENGIMYSVSFKDKHCSYWCIPDNSGDFFHIGHADLSGIFDKDVYEKRSYLISTCLNKPENPSFWEAVKYCVDATNALKKFKREEIPTNAVFINQNSPVSFM